MTQSLIEHIPESLYAKLWRSEAIALLNPLGDFGISRYTFELAEALAQNGVSVDVYGSGTTDLAEVPAPRKFAFYPVLGSALLKQRHTLDNPAIRSEQSIPGSCAPSTVNRPAGSNGMLRQALQQLRPSVMSLELAAHLRRRRYDIVWTQWCMTPTYDPAFLRMCKLLNLRTVHTVHNVLPHEQQAGDDRIYGRIYRDSDYLIVHSQEACAELIRHFGDAQGKTFVMRHGLYTTYARSPEGRSAVRTQFNIHPRQTLLLCYGGIRPYKNITAVLEALADDRCKDMILMIQGQELPACWRGGDKLAETRALVQRLGIEERVRLVPRYVSSDELSTFLEAADILMLPYLKSYGSGALLAGMTFGKHIVATRTGGSAEYLSKYSRSTLLNGYTSADVLQGMLAAAASIRQLPNATAERIPEFEWNCIAREILSELSGALERR